jgi:hypothetical protein
MLDTIHINLLTNTFGNTHVVKLRSIAGEIGQCFQHPRRRLWNVELVTRLCADRGFGWSSLSLGYRRSLDKKVKKKRLYRPSALYLARFVTCYDVAIGSLQPVSDHHHSPSWSCYTPCMDVPDHRLP